MRFSPTKLLHGLLCTTPILVLTLAACGGGGGGSTSTTPLASAYTLKVNVTGVSGAGLVLQNNGGDNLPVSSPGTYSFAQQVIAGTRYNVTALSHPSLPQFCSVKSPSIPSGTMPASVLTINVDCVAAYNISATISGGPTGTGLVLQNNGDNLLIPAGSGGTYSFNTPLIGSDTYNVTVLTQPLGQTCTPPTSSGPVSPGPVNVAITCGPYVPPAQADRYVYAANSGSSGTSGVSTYTSASGVLSAGTMANSGNTPAAIAVDRAGKFAYVVNQGSNSISGYSIAAGSSPVAGTLVTLDMDPATSGTTIATESTPVAITIHPSGKFAYVVNKISNSVSAYSIDATTGVLSQFDANGAASGTSIATGLTPVAIAIDPAGTHAYVVNVGSSAIGVCSHGAPSTNGCISAYSIDAYGVLTAMIVSGTSLYINTGVTPSSIAIDPSGQYVYVTNFADDTVSFYKINSDSTLSANGSFATGSGPSSVTIHPAGGNAYVANANGNSISVYLLIAGAPQLPSTSVSTGGSLPSSISIDSTGQYAYVANKGSNNISAFSISNGALTHINCLISCSSGLNFPAGINPSSVITAP